jgi:hypothetical protein
LLYVPSLSRSDEPSAPSRIGGKAVIAAVDLKHGRFWSWELADFGSCSDPPTAFERSNQVRSFGWDMAFHPKNFKIGM